MKQTKSALEHKKSHRRKRSRLRGFTIIDLMLVITIIGILASLGLNTFKGYITKAKRPEAIVILRAIADAQESHKAQEGHYAANFVELQFSLDSGIRVPPTELRSTHYSYVLTQPDGIQSWYCVATGNIDGDEWLDVLAAKNL